MDKEHDILKMLSPQSIDELEELLNKYPLSDKSLSRRIADSYEERSTMKKDNDFEYEAEETVDVIKKRPWYRSSAFTIAASLVIVAGLCTAGYGLIKAERNDTMSPASTVTETTTETIITSEAESESPDIFHFINYSVKYESLDTDYRMDNRIIRSKNEYDAVMAELRSQQYLNTKIDDIQLSDDYFSDKALVFFHCWFECCNGKLPAITSVGYGGGTITIEADREPANDEAIETWCGFLEVSASDIEDAKKVEVIINKANE